VHISFYFYQPLPLGNTSDALRESMDTFRNGLEFLSALYSSFLHLSPLALFRPFEMHPTHWFCPQIVPSVQISHQFRSETFTRAIF
jgi:hypothetical protein